MNIQKSTRKDKKLMVISPKGKLIHFGSRNMQHYKDKTGIWKSKDHLDDKRRKNYLSRSKGIKDKKGNLTYKNKESANYYSINYLW
jgi:hypothetical protein